VTAGGDELVIRIEANVGAFQQALRRFVEELNATWRSLPVRARHSVVAYQLGLDRHRIRTVTRRKQRRARGRSR